MSGLAKYPFTVGIEDLTCPVCDDEGAIYVREDVKHLPGVPAEAVCDDCGAALSLEVIFEPRFGSPKARVARPKP
jgi:hypothetical protein